MIGLLTRGSRPSGRVFPCSRDLTVALEVSLTQNFCGASSWRDLAVALEVSQTRSSWPSTVTGARWRRRAARSPLTVAGPCGILTHFPESSGAKLSPGSIAPPTATRGPAAPAACRTDPGRGGRDDRGGMAAGGRCPAARRSVRRPAVRAFSAGRAARAAPRRQHFRRVRRPAGGRVVSRPTTRAARRRATPSGTTGSRGSDRRRTTRRSAPRWAFLPAARR